MNVPVYCLPITKDEIKMAVSKGSGVLAITEEGFAKNLMQQGEALQ